MKTIITNGLVLIKEDGHFKTVRKDILIEGNVIAQITEPGSLDHLKKDVETKTINATGKLVMPGLINAHTHAYMTLFRNFADDQAFFDWLNNVQNVENYMTAEDCYWGTMLAAIEMFKSGTTCFVDMNIFCAEDGHTTGPKSACAGAASDAGIRAVMNRGLAGEADDPDSLAKFQTAINEINAFADNPLVTFMFGPHAPYSCMASYLKKLTDEAEKYGIGLNIHLSESKDEMAMIAEQHDGMTPIEYVDSLGIFRVPTLAAHCVQATDHDIEIFKEKGVSVALNPKSNMKLGNGFAPAAKFLEAGVNVALGTDGCGSNNSLNMFQEMNTAALVYKGANCSAQCVSAEEVLTMATEGGAKAIGMEGKLGVIAEGALADIIILNLDEPQFQPLNNIVSGLVYSSKGSEVETVIVDGRPVMENGHILSVNVAEVYAHCDEITKRLNMQK